MTLYVLVGDEEPGDPDISVNRIFSITPLEEIYGSPWILWSKQDCHCNIQPPR